MKQVRTKVVSLRVTAKEMRLLKKLSKEHESTMTRTLYLIIKSYLNDPYYLMHGEEK
jgi:hypothetical protein